MHAVVRTLPLLFTVAAAMLPAQTRVNLSTQAKNVDFTGLPYTRPIQAGTALPAVCVAGDLFFRTDVTPGSNLYACTATNTWAQLAGGGALPVASETEAQAGVSNSSFMTPLRTAQAVAAQCALPPQAGNAGKGLTTDGSAASWSEHLRLPPSASQAINATGNTILANALNVRLSPTADFTLTSTPTIAAGTNGQWLLLCNDSASYTVALQDETILANTKLRVGGVSLRLAPRQCRLLTFNGTLQVWVKGNDSEVDGPVLNRSVAAFVEEFMPGGYGDTTLGTLGWRVGGNGASTFNHTVNEASHPGVIRLASGAASGNEEHMFVNGTSITHGMLAAPNTTANWEWQAISKTDTATSVSYVAAMSVDMGVMTEPTKEGFAFWASSSTAITCQSGDLNPATGNWVMVSTDSSLNRWCKDTGVALIASTWMKFRIRSIAGGTILYSLGTGTDAFGAETANAGNNLPTNRLGVYFAVKTLTTADRYLYVDWVSWKQTGLTR